MMLMMVIMGEIVVNNLPQSCRFAEQKQEDRGGENQAGTW